MFPVFLNLSAWKAPLVFSLMPRSDLIEAGYYKTYPTLSSEKGNEEKYFVSGIALVPWTDRFLAGPMFDWSSEKLSFFKKPVSLKTKTFDIGTLFSIGENFGVHTDLYYRKETTSYEGDLDSDLVGFIGNAVYAFSSKFSLGLGISFSQVKNRKPFQKLQENGGIENSFLAALGYVYENGNFRSEGWLPGNAKASYSFTNWFAISAKYKLRSSKFYLQADELENLTTLRRTHAFVGVIPEFLLLNHLRIEPQVGARIKVTEQFKNAPQGDTELKDNFSPKVSPFAMAQVGFKF
jgi:hypothetical protein